MVLEVKNLTTSFDTDVGRVNAIDGISLNVIAGKTLGIVGESGCGKSVTALSIMRLLPKPSGKVLAGEILYSNKDILKEPIEEMRKIRGDHISMIFQEPMTALNPVHNIGKQLKEVFMLKFPEMTKSEVINASVEMLEKVGIPAPKQRLSEYPHQLSGGMRQRVMIAMALACQPEILIADEPTTALDVTIQAQILDLMKQLQKEFGTAIIFITHDLGVIAETCDDVIVMYAGKIVEKASVNAIFDLPLHPYTQGLLKSIPVLTSKPKTKLITIQGVVPDLRNLPSGCRFHNRCLYVKDKCRVEIPVNEQVKEDHSVSCFFWKEINS
jgi:oligopeptide/dipeptide ABC transporter ATP-binding protein